VADSIQNTAIALLIGFATVHIFASLINKNSINENKKSIQFIPNNDGGSFIIIGFL